MTQTLRKLLRRLQRDVRGLTTVEYTIVLVLIAALGVGVWSAFGEHVKAAISGADSTINKKLEGAAQNSGDGASTPPPSR